MTKYVYSVEIPQQSVANDTSPRVMESIDLHPVEQDTQAEEGISRITPWKAYEDSKYDSPVINRLVPWPVYYYWRWKILSIFHTRLIFGIVVGEVIVFILLIGGLAGFLAAVGNDDEDSGSVAIIPSALAFAFACRNSLWILFTGLPFERALMWHKLCAYLSVLVGAWHGYVSAEWDGSGLVLTGSMAALALFSFWPIRRKFFEAFYRIHWILFLVVIVSALIHEAGAIIFGVGLWGIDIILRAIITFLNNRNERSILAVRLPSNVIRLTFLKNDFNYKAGQYCFICVPGVSLFEWHPFSLSSSPHEPMVSLHIRVLGDWTKRLYDFVDQTRPIPVYIDGPYGAPCLDIDGERYKHVMFISGGIGITPMQSICNDILFQRRRGRNVQKVMFIWSVRDLYMVSSVLDYDKEYFNKTSSGRLPYSFSPDLLNRDEPPEVMENYFHLTRERDASKFEEANIQPEIQPDLKFGRPQLEELFTKMKAYALGGHEKRVAVLTCGPATLVSNAEKLCVKHSSDGVTFDFHKEVFEF